MKRTFGRMISLMLVLAMVLAMVPAVLAGSTYSVEVGSTISVSSQFTTASTVTDLAWASSDTTVATVDSGSNGTVTVTGVKNGTATITASGKRTGSAATTVIDTFTVYVQDVYSLTLAVSGSNVTTGTIALNQDDTRTITATVSVASNYGVVSNLENCKVQFSSDNMKALSVSDQAVKVTKVTTGGYTTYKAETTVTAMAAGGATLTAQVLYKKGDLFVPSTSANATKQLGFTVKGQGTISVTLPDAQQRLNLEANGTSATLQPKVTGYSGNTQPRLMYLYDNTNMYVRPSTTTATATVEPYTPCGATKIYICLESYNAGLTYDEIDQDDPAGTTKKGKTPINGSYAVCTVSIKKAGTSVTALTVANSDSALQKALTNGTKVFGIKDAYAPSVNPANLVNSITLNAKITAPTTITGEDLRAAYSRIGWTSSNSAVVSVSNNTFNNNSASVTLVPHAAGTATITADVDGVKATYNVTVYQGRAYEVTVAPSLGSNISSGTRTELENRFKQETATVEVKTADSDDEDGYTTYRLAVTDVRATVSGNKVTFTYGIQSLKTDTHEFFYAKDGKETYTSESNFSDIGFDEEPASANYKLTDTFADLVTEATVETGELKSFVWYMTSDQSTGADSIIYTDTITAAAEKSNHRSTLSNIKQYISGTGTYVFYCRVTAESGSGTSKTTSYADTRKAIITVTGENHINIVLNPTTVKAGDTFTITGTPQNYRNGKLENVTGQSYTITWSVSDEDIVKLASKTTTNSSPSISATAKSGGTVTLKAETTIGAKKYSNEVKLTVTVPTAETVSVTLGENETYVLLDGSKLAAAVKDAVKTTPTSFVFKAPANGTLYTSSSMTGAVNTTTKYTSAEVSRMAYRPARTTGIHEIQYDAYDGSAQIATGTVRVMTSSTTVEYHISANDAQQMVVSDFQKVYGSGTLSSVTFGTNSDSRGALYKGNTTSAGKVASEEYYASTGNNLLRNVYFIAGATTAKYTVTIPFTASGSAGKVSGQLVVYVNDTHTLNSVGSTFRAMGIASELMPENATASSYIVIDKITGGKLYSQYTSIKSCTPLTSKDYGSTKFSFSGTNSVDTLYVLPVADSTVVTINYTIDGSTKGSLSFKVNQQTASSQFTDVSGSSKWAANSVDFMYTNDIIKGNNTKNPRLFGPNAKMTRAMLVTVLYRAAGEPTVAGITNKFTDNKEGQYYYNAVLWASSKGIVNGATATTFDPNGNITREQIAAILYRYAGSPTTTGSLSGYSDQSQVSSFAVTAMQWAVGKGIITGITSGSKTTLSAKGNATRAQVAVMLHRFLTFD